MLVIIYYLFLTLCHAVFSKPSNIILFLTDDQDLFLGGMTPMKYTIDLIANQGVTFQNAFVNTPICCPSRSSLLTGKLPHNTHVKNNSLSGNCVGARWRAEIEPTNVAKHLEMAGYVNFYAGKYLNQYGEKQAGGISHIPAGYHWWFGLKGNSRYYNYTLSENGTSVHYVDEYLTDVIKTRALSFLDRPDATRKPFFMVLATPAPHAPFTPAPRHKGCFAGVKALRTPAFNHTSDTTKHWLIRSPPGYLPENVTKLDLIQENRLETLLSVDELVQEVIDKLSQIGQLENTYMIYTSDNGFHIGQFSLPWDKRQPYDTDIRIPLLLRGPRLPKKVVSLLPVQMIDIAPTILDMADVKSPPDMDGQSFLSDVLLEQSRRSRNIKKNILIEYHGEGNDKTNDGTCPWSSDVHLSECSADSWCKCQDSTNNTYNCIRQISDSGSTDFLFCKMLDEENFREAYDLTKDKYQLENIYSEMNETFLNYYDTLLDKLVHCKGINCRNE